MSLSTAFVCILGLYIFAYIRREKSKLNAIPAVGLSGILTSRIGALTTFSYGHRKVQEGYEKYPIFKIPRFFSWLMIAHQPEHLKDIARARDDQISFYDALNRAGQFEYTIGPDLNTNLYHISIARGPMSRNIAVRFPDLLDEINKGLEDILAGADKGWIDIACYKSVVHTVSRVVSRFFVGSKLSANSRYTDLMQGYTYHIGRSAFVIRLFPTWLKPIVNKLLFNSPVKLREVEDYLRPIIMQRLEKGIMDEAHKDSNDMITWLWNAAPEKERTVHHIAVRMIFFNFAAIHTTSALLSQVLFNLATYPPYIEPLREEISAVVNAEGWTKEATESMRKLDSFMKESQRLHGSDAVMIPRWTVNDFVFSDGTVVPKGYNLMIAGRSINRDERYYPNAQEFQGFRFVDKDPSKWSLTSLNPEYMSFGTGRHACPGRFFAAAEVKTMVARLLLDYDIKLTDEKAGRPENHWITGLFGAPNQTARISLRKRVPTVIS